VGSVWSGVNDRAVGLRGSRRLQETNNTIQMKLTTISFVAALVLGGLMACGNLAVAQDAATNGTKKGKGGGTVEQRMERLDKELTLTDAQKPKVKALLEETDKKMKGLRDVAQDERQAKGKEIRDEQNKKMKEILTADQYTKYEAAMQRHGKGGKKKAE
jgi:periplasmic protein CpxP/Spy